MWADRSTYEITNANIITSFDVWILLGFHYIMPLLELLNGLIKMAQA
jgi:hypothetical protein